jgi:ABC-2 type transport system ATP-binding protein
VPDQRFDENEPAVEVRGLTREFGTYAALDGVDLDIPRGAIFGLLGPNGAGKTTTVRILNGVLAPTSAGTLRVLGYDLTKQAEMIRPLVGVQTDTTLYERLSARQNLALFARFYGMDVAQAARRADELLDMFGLLPRAKERVEKFSKGMKQKILLARALVGSPQLVYFDEPTAGLDPEASHDLMSYVRQVSTHEHITFFIASHRLEEMEGVCTRVAVLAGGRIRAQGAPVQVARAAVPRVRVRITPVTGVVLAAEELRALPGAVSVAAHDGSFTVDLVSDAAVPEFVRATARMPYDLLGVAEEPATLQEAYLALVGATPGSGTDVTGEVA